MLEAFGASKSLEAEYIRSLHKQIYLFELENKYLRKELEKAKPLRVKPKHSEPKANRLRFCKCNALYFNANK